MGEFLAHSTAVWLNPHPSLGRIRKDPEMTVFGERTRPQTSAARLRKLTLAYQEHAVVLKSLKSLNCWCNRSCFALKRFEAASKNICFPPVSPLLPGGVGAPHSDAALVSLPSFQESCDIGLQGKQQAEEEDGESRAPLSLSLSLMVSPA